MLVWQKGATLRGTGERTRDRQIWLRISPGRERMSEDGEVCEEDIIGDGLFLKVLVLVMELYRYMPPTCTGVYISVLCPKVQSEFDSLQVSQQLLGEYYLI